MDLLFNVAHTIAFETLGPKVVMINAYDNVRFDRVASDCAMIFEIDTHPYRY